MGTLPGSLDRRIVIPADPIAVTTSIVLRHCDAHRRGLALAVDEASVRLPPQSTSGDEARRPVYPANRP